MMLMMMLVLIVLSQIIVVVVSGSGVQGWTYRTTTSGCAGTVDSPCGPDYWDKIAPTCSSALSSATQSPIDISQAVPIDISQAVLPIINSKKANNQTFEVSLEGQCDDLSITYNEVEYELQHIHFHSPSEHTVGGGHTAAEAHFVHVSSNNDIIVLGIQLEVQGDVSIGASNNTFLNTFWTAGGQSNTETVLTGEKVVVNNSTVNLDPYSLLPGTRSYYTYIGSLTVPSCTEGVKWILFDQRVIISRDDIAFLRALMVSSPNNIASKFGNTNRVTQPLNGRVVSYYDGGTYDAANNAVNDAPTYEDITTSISGSSFETTAVIVSLVLIVVLSFGLYLLSIKVSSLSSLSSSLSSSSSTKFGRLDSLTKSKTPINENNDPIAHCT